MKKILVVDDDRVSLEALKEILSAQGWEAQTAQTPEQAASLFQHGDFDLVVSDINLEAAQSGLDLLKQFRAACPVILITGFGTLDTTVKATQEGAWDLISKPFKVKDVLAVVQRALEQNRANRSEPAPEPLANQLEQTGLVGRAP